MKKRTVAIGIAVLVIVAALVYALAGHRPPAGQPPLVDLTATGLPAFQEEFNRHADEVRVILLLSPT